MDQIEAKVVEDLTALTEDEKAAAWSKWVRNEVNSLLDIYLPLSVEGDVNIQYHHRIEANYESGPVYHDTEVDAAKVTIVFKFENPVDISKPRIEGDANA